MRGREKKIRKKKIEKKKESKKIKIIITTKKSVAKPAISLLQFIENYRSLICLANQRLYFCKKFSRRLTLYTFIL